MLRVLVYILYLPVMVALIGVSAWLFKAFGHGPENPVVFLLWGSARILPGAVGMTGFVCAPLFLDVARARR